MKGGDRMEVIAGMKDNIKLAQNSLEAAGMELDKAMVDFDIIKEKIELVELRCKFVKRLLKKP